MLDEELFDSDPVPSASTTSSQQGEVTPTVKEVSVGKRIAGISALAILIVVALMLIFVVINKVITGDDPKEVSSDQVISEQTEVKPESSDVTPSSDTPDKSSFSEAVTGSDDPSTTDSNTQSPQQSQQSQPSYPTVTPPSDKPLRGVSAPEVVKMFSTEGIVINKVISKDTDQYFYEIELAIQGNTGKKTVTTTVYRNFYDSIQLGSKVPMTISLDDAGVINILSLG